MTLIIDGGNSRIKFGFYKDSRLIHAFSASWEEVETCLGASNCGTFLQHELWYHQTDSIYAGLSGVDRKKMVELLCLNLMRQKPLFITSGQAAEASPVNLENYPSNQLGIDRIGALTGAAVRFPGQPLILLDAGTALTGEIIDSSGCYQGGAIAPGRPLLEKSLRDVNPILSSNRSVSEKTPEPGCTTEGSVAMGIHSAFFGTAKDLSRTLKKHLEKNPSKKEIITIATGGDGKLLADAGIACVTIETLVLDGLEYLSRHLEINLKGEAL